MMKKLLLGLALLFASVASNAQFSNGQVLTAQALNAALAAPTITGGSINGSPIGATNPSTGVFTNATIGSLTVTGGFSPSAGTISLASLATQAANTVVANVTASVASPVAFAMPSCSTSSSALQYTSGTGFTCGTSLNAATLSGATFASPGPIGSTTASTGAFTNLTASGTVSGTGISNLFSSPSAIGGTAPNAGSFTNLSSSGTVSGTGFSNYLASPPAIGGTAAAAGSFTNLSSSGTVSGTGFTNYLASPPAIGGSAAAAGTFTNLASTGTFTPSQTNGIVGTTAANNANAGSVGEYGIVGVTQGSALPMTNSTNRDITSVTLSAGDWDVTGTVGFVVSTGAGALLGWINTSSATQPSLALGYGFSVLSLASNNFGNTQIVVQTSRISIATATTVYLSAESVFSAGTVSCWGYMRYRRVR